MDHQRRLQSGCDQMKAYLQKGIGIIEVMVAVGISGVGLLIIMNGIDFLSSKKTVVDKNATLEFMVSGIIESIRSNISMEKLDFKPHEFLERTNFDEVEASLNLCWVKDGMIPRDAYPNCPGKMGYVVTPFRVGSLELRGLYKVTLRLTHAELFPNEYRQYEFVVKDL